MLYVILGLVGAALVVLLFLTFRPTDSLDAMSADD